MSQAPHETINVSNTGKDLKMCSVPAILTCFNYLKTITHPSTRRRKHRTTFPALSRVLVLFSQCIRRWRRKRTRRWLRIGRRTPTVSLYLCVSFNLVLHTDSSPIDRFILCFRCIVDLGVNSGCSTEPTRHFQFLPLKHLPDYSRA